MRAHITTGFIFTAAVLSACSAAAPVENTAITLPESTRSADYETPIIGTNGIEQGMLQIFSASNGVVIRLAVSGLEPGFHGMHFHTKGDCQDNAAGFKSTGGHIMPLGKPHGFYNSEGPHAGNLPNLFVGKSGEAVVELYSNLVTFDEGPAALLDEDGATLIIHANEDDHASQPIGGSGPRQVCALIARESSE